MLVAEFPARASLSSLSSIGPFVPSCSPCLDPSPTHEKVPYPSPLAHFAVRGRKQFENLRERRGGEEDRGERGNARDVTIITIITIISRSLAQASAGGVQRH